MATFMKVFVKMQTIGRVDSGVTLLQALVTQVLCQVHVVVVVSVRLFLRWNCINGDKWWSSTDFEQCYYMVLWADSQVRIGGDPTFQGMLPFQNANAISLLLQLSDSCAIAIVTKNSHTFKPLFKTFQVLKQWLWYFMWMRMINNDLHKRICRLHSSYLS